MTEIAADTAATTDPKSLLSTTVPRWSDLNIIESGAPPLGPPNDEPPMAYHRPDVNIPLVWSDSPHQVYIRVADGNTKPQLCIQQVLVYRNWGAPTAGVPLAGSLIDTFCGAAPATSGWHVYEPTTGPATYYFGGRHRDTTGWNWDGGVVERQQRHKHGVLFRFSFGDNHDGRYNDYIIEVALVWVAVFNAANSAGSSAAAK